MVTPVLITFAIILGVMLIPFWLFVIRPEQVAQSAVLKRLRVDRKPAAVRMELVKAAQRLSAVPTLDMALSRSREALTPVETLLTQADSQMTVGAFLLACGTSGIVAATVALLLTRTSLIALVAGVGACAIPFGVMNFKRNKRIAKFEEQFPESLDLLSRALRAGHAFTTGLQMVADEMPKPVGPEFRTIYDQQNYGMPIGNALKTFAERVPLLDAKFFVTAVMTQRESGGNLSEILDNLASVIRDRFKVKRQIQVISAHGRVTGWVLSAVPPVLAFVMFLISPDNMKVLVTDPLGKQMLAAAVFLQIAGALIIRRLVRIEY
jgi:tight adherence protein B